MPVSLEINLALTRQHHRIGALKLAQWSGNGQDIIDPRPAETCCLPYRWPSDVAEGFSQSAECCVDFSEPGLVIWEDLVGRFRSNAIEVLCTEPRLYASTLAVAILRLNLNWKKANDPMSLQEVLSIQWTSKFRVDWVM